MYACSLRHCNFVVVVCCLFCFWSSYFSHITHISDCESGDCEGYGDGDAPHLQSTGEIEAQDSDIRSNLLELQRSRLYSGKDRKLPLHTPDDEEGDGNSLLHDEF